MTVFREIKSPIALAACGAFLMPEPLGTCLVVAAAIWWLCRKTGKPLRTLLSFWVVRAVRGYFARLSKMGSRINMLDRGNNLNTLKEVSDGSVASRHDCGT